MSDYMCKCTHGGSHLICTTGARSLIHTKQIETNKYMRIYIQEVGACLFFGLLNIVSLLV